MYVHLVMQVEQQGAETHPGMTALCCDVRDLGESALMGILDVYVEMQCVTHVVRLHELPHHLSVKAHQRIVALPNVECAFKQGRTISLPLPVYGVQFSSRQMFVLLFLFIRFIGPYSAEFHIDAIERLARLVVHADGRGVIQFPHFLKVVQRYHLDFPESGIEGHGACLQNLVHVGRNDFFPICAVCCLHALDA